MARLAADVSSETAHVVATAASSVKAAVITGQSPQAFRLAVPLTVEVMTNVAVS